MAGAMRGRFFKKRLCARISATVVGCFHGYLFADTASPEFNARFLYGNAALHTDISRFYTSEVEPGIYDADVLLNKKHVARLSIEIRKNEEGESEICWPSNVGEFLGLDAARVSDRGFDKYGGHSARLLLPADSFCGNLGLYIPNAKAEFDTSEQTLSVSIPQFYLAHASRDRIDPELWDYGIPAGLLSYRVNHQELSGAGRHLRSTSALLDMGVNIGMWRIRHDGYLSYDNTIGRRYRLGRIYAQRAIPRWRAQLTLGEGHTRGELFESSSYRGVNLASEDRMLPDSQRAYAPVVRGVARTDARVTISQQGRVLHETQVAAGAFEISELYGTGYGGNLTVTVAESDGQVQQFEVPFAVVPQMIREGQRRFNVVLGQLRGPGLHNPPALAELTFKSGIKGAATVFGGLRASRDYMAWMAGGALNTRLGALSADVTFSYSSLDSGSEGRKVMRGYSTRLTYSKNLVDWGTYLSIAAYRYSTHGYMTLDELALATQRRLEFGPGWPSNRLKSRLDLSLNQRLGHQGGALTLNASNLAYRSHGQRISHLSLGYGHTFKTLSYNILIQRGREWSLFRQESARTSNSLHLNLVMPLGGRPGIPRLNTSLVRNARGGNSVRNGVSGTLGSDRRGSYTLATSLTQGRSLFNGGVHYQLPQGSFTSSFTHGRDLHQWSLGFGGGAIIHGGGITLSQPLGDTAGLVYIPNTPNVLIASQVGIKTNRQGYAVVPRMMPYRRNTITMDPKELSRDIELESASLTTIPAHGAVVRMIVSASSGRGVLMEALTATGDPLPFGVDVVDDAGVVKGVVGQASRLWVHGIDERGRLWIRRGNVDDEQCVIDYDLQGKDADDVLVVHCKPVRMSEAIEIHEVVDAISGH